MVNMQKKANIFKPVVVLIVAAIVFALLFFIAAKIFQVLQ